MAEQQTDEVHITAERDYASPSTMSAAQGDEREEEYGSPFPAPEREDSVYSVRYTPDANPSEDPSSRATEDIQEFLPPVSTYLGDNHPTPSRSPYSVLPSGHPSHGELSAGPSPRRKVFILPPIGYPTDYLTPDLSPETQNIAAPSSSTLASESLLPARPLLSPANFDFFIRRLPDGGHYYFLPPIGEVVPGETGELAHRSWLEKQRFQEVTDAERIRRENGAVGVELPSCQSLMAEVDRVHVARGGLSITELLEESTFWN